MRTYTMGEMIADCEETMRRHGRTLCPFTAELRQHPEWTVDDVEAWLFPRADLCAPVCCDVIRSCGWFNDEATTAGLQLRFAKGLVQTEWDMARVHVETLLHLEDIPHGISGDAAMTIKTWVATNHPKAQAFLDQDVVARNLGIAA